MQTTPTTPIPMLCQWCEVDGRCLNGVKVRWTGSGRIERPCHCVCHTLRADHTKGGR